MKVKQFKDEPLSHYSYALVSKNEMVIIDPTRNPRQYYDFAEKESAKIVAVLETHPHADFVSGHLQIHNETGAKVYVSSKLGAGYPHETFDEDQTITVGTVTIKSIFTPGHSPDGLSFHASNNNEHILFTGDTLFIGDIGRPDLRENDENSASKRKELASQMFHTIQNKYSHLPDHTVVYPTHGAGSLCGKNMSDANSSTLGKERQSNWAFNTSDKEKFINTLLEDQPFIPSYFKFNVDVNQQGAENVQFAKYKSPLTINKEDNNDHTLIVDVRDELKFKKGHLPNSINIMARSENDKFETWLGAIIKPEEPFLLAIESVSDLDTLLERTAKIGYEQQLKGILTISNNVKGQETPFNYQKFRDNTEDYTIIDIRNKSEVMQGKIFDSAITIPLNELRDRHNEIPKTKPIVVHCAGGYRSAAAYSILSNIIDTQPVLDLSDHIKKFKS